MLPTTNQLPTLGYFHKVVCDCLGIWKSDNEDIKFHVEASEKDRRAALRQAFELMKNEDGRYGSLDDLVVATTQLAPQNTQKVKKGRTIQAYVNHLSKTDFESIDEYSELRQYIEVLLNERYARWGVAELAINFYLGALAYYREFVREYACNAQNQNDSYKYFLSENLHLLIRTLTRELFPTDDCLNAALYESWPLKAFADAASRLTGISLHKLHQYHQFQQERPPNEQGWDSDLTAWEVNTRSKQVIDRLGKRNRMKWETFYPTLQPLIYHLKNAGQEKLFATQAFAAMIAHNINDHVANCGPIESETRRIPAYSRIDLSHPIPSSDILDMLFNDYPIGTTMVAEQAPDRYQAMLKAVRALPGSLTLDMDIPNCLEQVYKEESTPTPEQTTYVPLANGPDWLNEWALAQNALCAGDALLALSHFKTAFAQAKYVAGPLFIPFYIQVCVFCKSQYGLLSANNEEKLWERFYEELGSNAARYASLIGYTPQYQRDPQTLLPYSTLPLKSRLIMGEIDAQAKSLRS
jgi:hypothetical protein